MLLFPSLERVVGAASSVVSAASVEAFMAVADVAVDTVLSSPNVQASALILASCSMVNSCTTSTSGVPSGVGAFFLPPPDLGFAPF